MAQLVPIIFINNVNTHHLHGLSFLFSGSKKGPRESLGKMGLEGIKFLKKVAKI